MSDDRDIEHDLSSYLAQDFNAAQIAEHSAAIPPTRAPRPQVVLADGSMCLVGVTLCLRKGATCSAHETSPRVRGRRARNAPERLAAFHVVHCVMTQWSSTAESWLFTSLLLKHLFRLPYSFFQLRGRETLANQVAAGHRLLQMLCAEALSNILEVCGVVVLASVSATFGLRSARCCKVLAFLITPSATTSPSTILIEVSTRFARQRDERKSTTRSWRWGSNTRPTRVRMAAIFRVGKGNACSLRDGQSHGVRHPCRGTKNAERCILGWIAIHWNRIRGEKKQ